VVVVHVYVFEASSFLSDYHENKSENMLIILFVSGIFIYRDNRLLGRSKATGAEGFVQSRS
jgi:hypothetical protein